MLFKRKLHQGVRHRAALAAALLLAMTSALAACGDDSGDSGDSGKGGGDTKLIVVAQGSPCGLNEFTKSMCKGFDDAEKALPDGYELQVKTGTDYADQTAFNNLLQTSAELKPAGMVVYPGGSSSQVPVLEAACAKGIKIVTLDAAIEGLDCQSAAVVNDHTAMGADLGKWLVEQNPTNKKIGIVSFAPGQASGLDQRVAGFTEVVEAAGFEIVATVNSDLQVDKTRTMVTNMLTANPDLGIIFSTNDQLGYGTAEAVEGEGADVMEITIDGNLDAVQRIVDGTLAADLAGSPHDIGKNAVLAMVDLLEGKDVPTEVVAPTLLVDETNASQYLADGGLES